MKGERVELFDEGMWKFVLGIHLRFLFGKKLYQFAV